MAKNSFLPYIFDEFFASGREESISPFLTPASRRWGKNLPLKTACLSALFLAFSFTASFIHPSASYLALAAVYFLSGVPALIGALEDLKNYTINIDVLMTMAALLSVAIGSGMEGALLLVLFEFSAAMENAVTQKTRSAIISLNQLAPRQASVINAEGVIYERSVKEIPVGAHLLIKAGEVVPLDGHVINGKSFVNLVHLTGESAPVSKVPGDEVQAGARNLDGTLTIKVNRTSANSTLSKIIQLIIQAQEAKPKLEKWLDRFGKYYASSIILLAFFFALSLPWIFSIPYTGPEGAIYRALTFLIAASPCALIIATPTAYLSTISSCARKGILLKGGAALDALAKCDIIAFDKTGTLTTGQLTCDAIVPLNRAEKMPCDEDTALAVAAALEQHAVHPIAHAITAHARARQLLPIAVENFKATAGSGLEGDVRLGNQTFSVAIGHPAFIATKLPPELHSEWEQLKTAIKREGRLSTLLLIGNALFAFHFIDTVRPHLSEVLQKLRDNLKLKLIMLTGDHAENAQTVGKALLLDEIHADLRPEDKLNKVAELSREKGLAMVGDGVNDAPALARATVGISMGKIGSATAVDASDIVFLQDDLSLLEWLVRKAHQNLSIIKQNLTLALAVIFFATTPALLGLVPLWVAVILHEGGTVLVGFNSLRLLRGK